VGSKYPDWGSIKASASLHKPRRQDLQ